MNTSLYGPSVETLWTSKRGRRRKGRGLTAGTNLTPEITALLGDAEHAFSSGDDARAIALLSEVTKKAPKLPEPYSMLAMIYDNSGQKMNALQLYALAASFTSKSIDLWSKVAKYALGICEYSQALNALNRCIKLCSAGAGKKHLKKKGKAGDSEEEDDEDEDDEEGHSDDEEADFIRREGGSKDDEQEYHRYRLLVCLKMGKILSFKDYIKIYLDKFPEDLSIYLNVSMVFLQQGYDKYALDYLLKLLDMFHIRPLATAAASSSHPQGSAATSLSAFLYRRDELEDLVDNFHEVFEAIKYVAWIHIRSFCSDIVGQTVLEGKGVGMGSAHEPQLHDVIYIIESIFETFQTMQEMQPPFMALQHIEFPLDLVLALGCCKLAVATTEPEIDQAIKMVNPLLQRIAASAGEYFDVTVSKIAPYSVLEVQQYADIETQVWLLYLLLLISQHFDRNGLKARGKKLALLIEDVLTTNLFCVRQPTAMSAAAAAAASSSSSSSSAMGMATMHADEINPTLLSLSYPPEVNILLQLPISTSSWFISPLIHHFLLYFCSCTIELNHASLQQEVLQAMLQLNPMDVNAMTVLLHSSPSESVDISIHRTAQQYLQVLSVEMFRLQQQMKKQAVAMVADKAAMSAEDKPVEEDAMDVDEAPGPKEASVPVDADEYDSDSELDDDEDRRGNSSAKQRSNPEHAILEQILQTSASTSSSSSQPSATMALTGSNNGDDDDADVKFIPLHQKIAINRKVFNEILRVLYAFIYTGPVSIQATMNSSDVSNVVSLVEVFVDVWQHVHNSRYKSRETIRLDMIANQLMGRLPPPSTAMSADFVAFVHAMLSVVMEYFGVDSATNDIEGFDAMLKDFLKDISANTRIPSIDQQDFVKRVQQCLRKVAELVHPVATSYQPPPAAQSAGNAATGSGGSNAKAPQTMVHTTIIITHNISSEAATEDKSTAKTAQHPLAYYWMNRKAHKREYDQAELFAVVENISKECRDVAGQLTALFSDISRDDGSSTEGPNESESEALHYANYFFQLLIEEERCARHGASSALERGVNVRRLDYKFLENRLPARSLFSNMSEHPLGHKRLVAAMLLGHDHAIFREHHRAIDQYLHAFQCDSNQPMTALCLACYLIMLSNHPLCKNRYQTLSQGLGFFSLYQDLRRGTDDEQDAMAWSEHRLSDIAKKQETMYNLGRAFQELHLYHLAIYQYEEALALVERYPALGQDDQLSVVKECAHNLCQLYRTRCNAPDLAMAVMMKYLMFE